jgi:biopolymer transport protein ExbD
MIRSPTLLRIDVTPLVGVMLVLLTVSMVGLPQARGIEIGMSPPNGHWNNGEPMIGIDASGLTVNQQSSSLSTLARDLDAAGIAPSARLYVLGDGHLAYDDFMRVVNRLHSLGYDRLVLVNEDFE